MAGKKEWMLGLPGHKEVVALEDVVLLARGGQLRPTDLVKKLGEPWRAANEIAELASHFAPPGARPAPEPPRPEALPAKTPVREDLASAKTARLNSRLTERKIAAVAPKPAEIRRPSATRPPPSDTRPPPSDSRPPAGDSKPDDTPKISTRAVPRAPVRPKPRVEPMVPKYFSPVDLLRSASLAFEPRRLLLAVAMLAPLCRAGTLLLFLGREQTSVLDQMFQVLALALFVFGFALALMALGYVSRRQLEGEPYGAGDVVAYGTANLATGIIYPILVMIPSLLSLGVLWLLGFLRNWGSGAASFLKYFYILPMVFAFVAVLGAFVYQLASMYVPAAAAAEGAGLTGAVNAVWLSMRRQWGRVVLHWLIVTVAFGVITAVCVGLAALAVALPHLVFGEPPDPVKMAWGGLVSATVFSLYVGLALGLGLSLPASLFSTLGMLSYLSLRHPASATLAVAPEETSHGPMDSPRPPAGILEATQAAETRTGPSDSTGASALKGSSPEAARLPEDPAPDAPERP
jgi:hypothetical protein